VVKERGGIVSYDPTRRFQSAAAWLNVRDNFTSQKSWNTARRTCRSGNVRTSTSATRPDSDRDVHRSLVEFAMGGAAIAHNGKSQRQRLRRELIERGSIFPVLVG